MAYDNTPVDGCAMCASSLGRWGCAEHASGRSAPAALDEAGVRRIVREEAARPPNGVGITAYVRQIVREELEAALGARDGAREEAGLAAADWRARFVDLLRSARGDVADALGSEVLAERALSVIERRLRAAVDAD